MAKRRLEALRATLLNSQNLPRATLRDIMKECAEISGRRNVTISAQGQIGSSNQLTTAVAPS